MIKYPLSFPMSVEATSGVSAVWQASAKAVEGQQQLTVAIPPEFQGPGGGFSPEDIYGLALANCFVATFKVFAEKSQLTYSGISVDAELIVDRNEKGIPWMAEVKMSVTLSQPNVREKAERLLEKTSTSCMILNSVNTKKTFQFFIAD